MAIRATAAYSGGMPRESSRSRCVLVSCGRSLRRARWRSACASPTNAVADDPRAAALGQRLFFHTRFAPARAPLDAPGAPVGVACASCHNPARTGAELAGDPAVAAAPTLSRNPPTVLNAAYGTWFYWDGHADSLWGQAATAAEYDDEMGSTRLQLAHALFDHYRAPYETLFGAMPDLSDAARFPAAGKPGDASYDAMAASDRLAVDRLLANFGKAIEAYERRLVDASSPFDRYLGGEPSALSPGAVRGAKLFVGRASCDECHNGSGFNGGGYFGSIGVPDAPPYPPGRAAGLAAVLHSEFNTQGPFSDAPAASPLIGLTVRARDIGAFKTPTLRNLRQSAPYMHNGRFATLWDVLVFYRDAAGTDGFAGGRRAPAIQPLRLSDDDLADMVAFLQSLNGDPLPRALITAPALP